MLCLCNVTTCALSQRVYQHKYNGAIRLHLHEQHNEGAKLLTTENFTIIFNERQKSNLQIAEAILIFFGFTGRDFQAKKTDKMKKK